MNIFSFDAIGRLWFHWRTYILEWVSVGVLALLVIGPISMLAWLVFFTDTFVVENITIVDARDHTTEKIREKTEELLGQNILYIQTPVVEQRLLGDISELRDVHIIRKIPGTLKVIVQEKNPSLLLLSSGTYYFVDESGIAYEEPSLDTLPGIVLPVVKNTGEAAVGLGLPAVEREFVEFVGQAHEDLPEVVGAEVVEMRIPSLSAREVHFLFNNNWTIRLDTTRSHESQLDVLTRLLEGTIPEEERPRIDYIDLRIPSRAYYRLR